MNRIPDLVLTSLFSYGIAIVAASLGTGLWIFGTGDHSLWYWSGMEEERGLQDLFFAVAVYTVGMGLAGAIAMRPFKVAWWPSLLWNGLASLGSVIVILVTIVFSNVTNLWLFQDFTQFAVSLAMLTLGFAVGIALHLDSNLTYPQQSKEDAFEIGMAVAIGTIAVTIVAGKLGGQAAIHAFIGLVGWIALPQCVNWILVKEPQEPAHTS